MVRVFLYHSGREKSISDYLMGAYHNWRLVPDDQNRELLILDCTTYPLAKPHLSLAIEPKEREVKRGSVTVLKKNGYRKAGASRKRVAKGWWKRAPNSSNCPKGSHLQASRRVTKSKWPESGGVARGHGAGIDKRR